MKKFILSFLIAALSTSCAFHSGNISTGPVIDCLHKDIVTGEAYTAKVLGIGGLDKAGLILEAKRDLYSKYMHNKNLKLTNFSVDYKTTFVLVYMTKKATVSADLYYCGDDTLTGENPVKPIIGGVLPGDSIIYEHNGFYKGILNYHTGHNKCVITVATDRGKFFNRKVKKETIYKTSPHPDNKDYYGYDVGETVFVEVYILSTKTKVVKSCTVVGLHNKRLLITYLKDDGEERMLSVDKSYIKK